MQTIRSNLKAKPVDQSAPVSPPPAPAAPRALTAVPTVMPMVVPFAGLRAYGFIGSKATLRRAMREGKFPRPVYISSQRPVWRVADLQQWLASLKPVDPSTTNHAKSAKANVMKRWAKVRAAKAKNAAKKKAV